MQNLQAVIELALPRMDLPIGLLEWEVFLPQQFKVADFGGDATSARLFPPSGAEASEGPGAPAPAVGGYLDIESLGRGQIGGLITDPAGAVIPHATVTVALPGRAGITTTTDENGHWLVPYVPSGRVRITAASPGFNTVSREIVHDASSGSRISLQLQVGTVSETIEVASSASEVRRESKQVERAAKQRAAAVNIAGSANVQDLQRRVAGVLPIAVNVPRTGNSYRFVRPLVIDEETKLTFRYRSK